jgi:hypothetical protein
VLYKGLIGYSEGKESLNLKFKFYDLKSYVGKKVYSVKRQHTEFNISRVPARLNHKWKEIEGDEM